MDFLLKKNFWIIHLAVVGLCAVLLGRTSARVVSEWWLTDTPAPVVVRRSFAPLVEKTHGKEIDAIVSRNLFCSTCAPIKDTEKPAAEGPADHTPHKSDLSLELVSTMVVPSDEQWSMAVIRDTSTKEKDPGLYRTGSILPGGVARVVRVIEKKVYLTNGNRLEFLELDGAANTQATAAVVATAAPTGDPLDADIARGVRCSGSNCEIDRSLVDKMLNNTASLATMARFVPSIKDGHPNGFKLYAIRPNSVFAKIGLQNGDTVKGINGMDMKSPDDALAIYSKVRTASHLTVGVERRGETVSLDYTIR